MTFCPKRDSGTELVKRVTSVFTTTGVGRVVGTGEQYTDGIDRRVSAEAGGAKRCSLILPLSSPLSSLPSRPSSLSSAWCLLGQTGKHGESAVRPHYAVPLIPSHCLSCQATASWRNI